MQSLGAPTRGQQIGRNFRWKIRRLILLWKSLPDIGQEISPNGGVLISSATGHAADLYASDRLPAPRCKTGRGAIFRSLAGRHNLFAPFAQYPAPGVVPLTRSARKRVTRSPKDQALPWDRWVALAAAGSLHGRFGPPKLPSDWQAPAVVSFILIFAKRLSGDTLKSWNDQVPAVASSHVYDPEPW